MKCPSLVLGVLQEYSILKVVENLPQKDGSLPAADRFLPAADRFLPCGRAEKYGRIHHSAKSVWRKSQVKWKYAAALSRPFPAEAELPSGRLLSLPGSELRGAACVPLMNWWGVHCESSGR